MNCANARIHIEEYLDGTLEPATAEDLKRHLDGCSTCADSLADSRALRRVLRDLPVPEPSRDLIAGARERANRRHRGRITALAGGMGLAASLLIALAVGMLQPSPQPNVRMATVSLTPGKTETVRLMFNSSQRVENVTLSVELPQGMELAGYPDRARLTWKTDLEPGRNLLKLPVVLREPRTGLLKAGVRYNGRQRQFDLNIKPRAPKESALESGLRRI